MRISDDIRSSDLDNEVVLLDIRRGEYFSLDGTGRRFWQLMEAGVGVDAAISRMSEEYEVDAATLKTDIEELVGHLRERGILVD